MAAKFVSPAFHNDRFARNMLKPGPAYINVFENSFGDQFCGAAHSRRDLAEKLLKKRRKLLYRIVVRLKK